MPSCKTSLIRAHMFGLAPALTAI